MATLYYRSAMPSSLITNMNTNKSRSATASFGTWLHSKISERGWTQAEAAKQLGVSPPTVGRWLKGRTPEAAYLERVADVFVSDYDYVATLAGVRPRELLEIDPSSHTAELMPYIEEIDWETNPERFTAIKAQLQTYLDADRKAKTKPSD